MKKITILAGVAMSILLSGAVMESYAQQSGTVTIRVEGLRSGDGNVMLAVMSEDMSAKDWTRFDPMSTQWSNIIKFAAIEKSSTQGMQFIVDGLPEGEEVYVYLFHDENGNYMMDLDESWIPREGFVKGDGRAIPSLTVTGAPQQVEYTMTYL